MVGNDFKNKNKAGIDKRKKSRIIIISLMTSLFMLFAFVYVNSVILNNKIEATSGNNTHPINPNSTAARRHPIKQLLKKSTRTTNSSRNHQPNSNVSRLTTTQGNVTTNANAPGSPFPPKEANSTSYFPATNKVAIVLGAHIIKR